METTRPWGLGVLAIVLYASGCGASGQGLSLLHRATEEDTVRVLIENLSPEDAAAVDRHKVCEQSADAEGLWFDAIRLLSMERPLRSYSWCALGVRPDLIEATRLPLSPARRDRIERYVKEWKEVPVLPEAIFESIPAMPSTGPDYSTMDVLMALEAERTSDALGLCDQLGAKVGYRCSTQPLTGNRTFDTPESAVANDPFLTLYKPRHVATSRDGGRRFYILDTLKRPHDDTCRPVAVLVSASGGWSLERVECETTSGIAKGF